MPACSPVCAMMSTWQPARLQVNRKRRLFACACCRMIWERITAEISRMAVEEAELYADGDADISRAQDAGFAAGDVGSEGECIPHVTTLLADSPLDTSAIAEMCLVGTKREMRRQRAAQAGLLRGIFGNPFRSA